MAQYGKKELSAIAGTALSLMNKVYAAGGPEKYFKKTTGKNYNAKGFSTKIWSKFATLRNKNKAKEREQHGYKG